MTRSKRRSFRYGFALVVVVAAIALTLVPPLRSAGPSLMFMSVMLSAWCGGLGPGLFSVALISLLLLSGQLIRFIQDLPIEPWDILNVGVFVAFGTSMSLLIEALHAARHRAEESRRWLSAVLASIGDAVIATDDRGRVVFANPTAQALIGWSQAEVAGRPLQDVFTIVSEEAREPVENPVARALRDGKVVGLANHTLLISRDGAELPITDSAAPIRGEAGAVEGVVLAFRDDSERRRCEAMLRRGEAEMRRLNGELERRVTQRTEQLQAVNAELEEFSHSVAHDLRAPLRAISGFGQIVLDEYADRIDEAGKDYLRRMGAAAKRLEQLITDLLNLSRLSRGEMGHAAVDLSVLAESIAAELQQREPLRRVEVSISRGLVVGGDARLLRVALENLLGNAWKYTGPREEPRIEFGSVPIDGETAYFVSDNGAGFDMAYSEKLFRPFHRLHSQGEFPGTGIGLASVKRAVMRHGGRIWADGAVGRGATFYFTLGTGPAAQPARGGTPHGGEIHALGRG